MSTKVITGLVRFSYVNVFEPKSSEGSEPRYSISLLIKKSDKETLVKIKTAIEVAKQAGIGKLGGKIPSNLKIPIRDGDVEKSDDENYAGCYFLSASCKTKPGVVNKKRLAITDTTEFYSGCWGHASITFYAFNTNGNRGIACGLNNLLKISDGENLGGRANALDDFKNLEIEFDDDDFLFEKSDSKKAEVLNDLQTTKENREDATYNGYSFDESADLPF